VSALARALSNKAAVSGVTLLSFDNSGEPSDVTEGKLRTIVSRARLYKRSPLNPFLPLRFLTSSIRFDYLYLHQFSTWLTPGAVLWSKLRGARLLLTDHNGGGPTYNRQLRLESAVDVFLATSELSARECRLRVRNTRTIFGGVDTDFFSPGPPAPRDGVLFVGRAHPIKGIEETFEALRGATHGGRLTLCIAASSSDEKSYLERLDGLARSLREHTRWSIEFRINASADAMLQAYRSHAWTILPSRDQMPHESLGLTPLESLSCGTAAAVSEYCGSAELSRASGMEHFRVVRDWRAFFEDQARACYDADVSSRLREWACKNASWDAVASRVLEAISELKVRADVTGRAGPSRQAHAR
jgi:glycosyltransferase involved in cell wall biosynthesis